MLSTSFVACDRRSSTVGGGCHFGAPAVDGQRLNECFGCFHLEKAIKRGAGGSQKREGNELLAEVEADEALGTLGTVVKGSQGRDESKEKKITLSEEEEEEEEEEEYRQQLLLCVLLSVVSPHIVDSLL
ncbi:hypothetical protein C4D60_Mb07t06420 [Musa balbisiana]|uniref:Uncharacterized protein n=1 Tax=Musa balbisiana TaxID=52838 RepID=A0A4S8JDX8_MUSBA|nr:hypothetical protein C4D60_Mb07t06420 [Musa balbisiana]